MITEVLCYNLTCDTPHCNTPKISGFLSLDELYKSLDGSGWTRMYNRHYCPKCSKTASPQ